MLVAWLVFPVVLALLALGCGVAVERLTGRRLPGAVLLPLGLAVVVVLAHPPTLKDETAELMAPTVVVVALIGLVLLARTRPFPEIDRWAVAAAVAVFAVYAAPIVLSGDNAIAGYVELDDSASWVGIAERLGEQGTTYAGLQPSTYHEMLRSYLGGKYPIGGLLPLGLGDTLVGDARDLYQPYLAFLAAMLALCLYAIAGSVIASRPLRAGAAFIASQAALLFAYGGLWSGFKELATAWLVALIGALIVPTLRKRPEPAELLPLAITGAAVLSVLSVGGGVYLAAFTVPAVVILARQWGLDRVVVPIIVLAGLTAILALPSLLGLQFLDSVPLDEDNVDRSIDVANLQEPLSVLQALGIWLTSDFRFRPDPGWPSYVLCAILVGAAAFGVYAAVMRRAWTFVAYVAAAVTGAAVVVILGTPWFDAKAMAAVSPVFVLAALAGAAALAATGRQALGGTLAGVIALGVVWSNVLAYHGTTLTPPERFAELESIGERYAHQGPTLMTDFEPWGPRYLLRDADSEGASLLRFRQVNLNDGGILEHGQSADVDAFTLPAVLEYRTLVLRRSPFGSRPPSPYRRVASGRFYDVWQRGAEINVRGHESLQEDLDGAGRAPCQKVRELATRGPRLAFAEAPRPGAIVDPNLWGVWPNAGQQRVLLGDGARVQTDFQLSAAGPHEVWVGGEFRGALKLRIDGREVASGKHEITHSGFVPLGRLDLRAGRHLLDLEYGGGSLRPGSGGRARPFGPIVISPVRGDEVETIAARFAGRLCGRRLDWVEVVGA